MNFNIGSRTLSLLQPLASELQFKEQSNYLFQLSELGILSIEGNKGLEFLQGQLTCDTRLVDESHIQQGAQCNLQGRILSMLDVISWQGIKLISSQDLIEPLKASLNKTAMLSRITMHENSDYALLGLKISNQSDILPDIPIPIPKAKYQLTFTDQACCYSLDNNLYIYLVKKDFLDEFQHPFVLNNQLKGSLAWHYLQINRGHFYIYPETRGLFLPHRVNLPNLGYISFNKGCYKGQEIIARTHYKAKLKHELCLCEFETAETLIPGKKLFNPENNQEVGELIDFCPIAANRYVAAVSVLLEHPMKVIIEGHQSTVNLSYLYSM